MKRLFAAALAVLAGCATYSPPLSDPSPAGLSIGYAGGVHRAETIGIPVALEIPDEGFRSTVASVNILGSPYPAGTFASGEIVAREFRRFAADNFLAPRDVEAAVAKLNVRILGATSRVEAGQAESFVGIVVSLVNPHNDSTKVWTREFSASASAYWYDGAAVPSSFYVALESVMREFQAKWDADGAAALKRLYETAESDPGRSKVAPPVLQSIQWAEGYGKGVYTGRCTVLCRDYEGFRAKRWAAAQIAEECRQRLGGIEPERVRVVYDDEGTQFDSAAKSWTIAFTTFARAAHVLEYNSLTRHGFITGDLELMGMGGNLDAAKERLKDIVMSEMDSHDGPVSSAIRKGQARVRFDDVKMDGNYNLLTIYFRLVY